MRVLHLAPLWFPVSRDAVGGIETYLPNLLGALEARGCRNTLLASGDSRTPAELLPVIPRCLCVLMEEGAHFEDYYYEQHQLLLAIKHGGDFDVIHSHIGWTALVLSGVPSLHGRVLHTQHNPVYPDQEWFVSAYPDYWYSTVSESQARKLWRGGAKRCHVIPNGIEVDKFTFQPRGGEGLLFLGRIEDDKGPDLAVQVARALDRPLILAGPMLDDRFFDAEIKPYLNDKIQYIGVVDHMRKNELFGEAGCVLMPSRVNEGFGMVSVEAMACGTPVVALANGALPEIIETDLTGYAVSAEQDLAGCVTRALHLDRAAIRARVKSRFDLGAIAEQYLQLYSRIAG